MIIFVIIIIITGTIIIITILIGPDSMILYD